MKVKIAEKSRRKRENHRGEDNKKNNRENSKENFGGSITVFFALLLLLVSAVFCTAIEAARQAALSYLMAQAQESALESVFAGYYRPLWEQYHLFFVADGPGLADKMEAYLSCCGAEAPLEFSAGTVWTVKIRKAVDQGGRAYLEAICTDMESHQDQDSQIISDWDVSRLRVQADQAEEAAAYVQRLFSRTKQAEQGLSESGETESLFQTLKNWKRQKILTLVVSDQQEISEASLSQSRFPSDFLSEECAAGVQEKQAAISYMREHFGCWGEENEDSVLSYELEYLLGNTKSDQENLAAVAEKLLDIRTGMDFLYLTGDQQKLLEVKLLVAAAAGPASQTPLGQMLEALITGAWALAEAVNDTERLLGGDAVPFVKTLEDWEISLDGMGEVLLGKTEDVTAASPEQNNTEDGDWTYQKYLYLLLQFTPVETLLYRSMDLIEANLQQADAGFFMENCISYAEVETRFQAGGFECYKTASYGY